MEYNGLSTGASIAIGDTIMIPDGELGGPSAHKYTKPTHRLGLNTIRLFLPMAACHSRFYACPVTVHGFPKVFMATMPSI